MHSIIKLTRNVFVSKLNLAVDNEFDQEGMKY